MLTVICFWLGGEVGISIFESVQRSFAGRDPFHVFLFPRCGGVAGGMHRWDVASLILMFRFGRRRRRRHRKPGLIFILPTPTSSRPL